MHDGRVYHVWGRGVDGRIIFPEGHDHQRFLLSLKLFNSPLSLTIRDRPKSNTTEVEPLGGQRLVGIIAHTELDNHFHLALQEMVPDGLTKFLRKFTTGYTMYFNKKYARRGPLLESGSKYKPAGEDAYLQHLVAYIHLNVLDRMSKAWREGEVGDWQYAEQALRLYPWSSARFYLDGSRDPIVDYTLMAQLFEPAILSNHGEYLHSWSQRNLGDFVYSD